MRGNRLQSGLTLLELLVAVSILSVLTLGMGYVFTQSSGAVNLTQSGMQMNANLRAASGLMREELQCVTKDGFLCIVGKTVDGSNNPKTPPMIVFTALGRYASMLDSRRVANAAIVCYQPLKDSADEDKGVSLLGRYTKLLIGSPPELDDCSAMPLSQIQAINKLSSTVTHQFFVLPYMQSVTGFGYKSIKSVPEKPSEIADLWPYMVGGCKDVEVSFSDGRTRANYALALPAGTAAEWVTPEQAQTRGMPAGVAGISSASKTKYVIWTSQNKADWPKAIRMKMTMMTEIDNRPVEREYELIFSLP